MFKKNTAVTGFPFTLVNKSDGSAITAGTVTGYYTLDGGTQGSVAGTPVHEGNGQWSVNLLAAEMNGDVVGLLFTHTSAIPVNFTIKTDTKTVSELQDLTAAAVNSECDTALTDYDPPTNTEMIARTLVAASYATAANQTAIESDTQDLQIQIGTAGLGLSAVPDLAGLTTLLARASEVRLAELDAANLPADVDAILVDTGTTLPATLAALENISTAQVNAEVAAALATYDPPTRTEATADVNTILAKLLNYVQLVLRSDAAIATDNATELTAINADEGSGAGDFSNQTDAVEAIRDKQTDIETDTAQIGAAGAGLTDVGGMSTGMKAEVQSEATDALNAYDPPTKTELDSAVAPLSLEATVATVNGVVDAILVDTDTTIPALIAALNDLSAAQVNAEVVDVLTVDTIAELAQGVPATTPTFATAVMLLYMTLRNKLNTNATELNVYNNAGTRIAKKALTDDGTDYIEAKMISGV